METLISLLTNAALINSVGLAAILALIGAGIFYRLYTTERKRNNEMVDKFIDLSVSVQLTLQKILDKFNRSICNDERSEK